MSAPAAKPAFDRTVGFGLLFALVLETAGGVHWAGRTSQRISQLESKARMTHPIDLRLARLEEQMHAARDSLQRIERDLNTVEGAQ